MHRRRNRIADAAEQRILTNLGNDFPHKQPDPDYESSIRISTFRNVPRILDFLTLKDVINLQCAFPGCASVSSKYAVFQGKRTMCKNAGFRRDAIYVVEDEYILKRLSKRISHGDYDTIVTGLNSARKFINTRAVHEISIKIEHKDNTVEYNLCIFFKDQQLISEPMTRYANFSTETRHESFRVFNSFVLTNDNVKSSLLDDRFKLISLSDCKGCAHSSFINLLHGIIARLLIRLMEDV